MLRIKLYMIALVIASALTLLSPASKASDFGLPPAIVFIHDKYDNMLLKDNFNGDNGIYAQGNMKIDKGFFVEVPQGR